MKKYIHQLKKQILSHRTRNLIVLGILLIVTMLTVIIVREQNIFKSNADTDPASIVLTPQTQTLKSGDSLQVDILIDTKGRNIMGADLSLHIDTTHFIIDGLELTKDFSQTILNSQHPDTGDIRFILAETENTSHDQALLKLGTLKLHSSTAGVGTVTVTKAQVVKLGANGKVPLTTLPTAVYTTTSTGTQSAIISGSPSITPTH